MDVTAGETAPDFLETYETPPQRPEPIDDEPEFEPDDVDDDFEQLRTRLARPAARGFDAARYAAAVRNKPRLAPAAARPLEPALSREECGRCGIPGWKGCDHQLAYVAEPPASFRLPVRVRHRTAPC